MSQKVLILNIILIGLKISILNAQIPSLNPEQTVNLPTGEMQFCLPLGTVQGVNGHDFPVTLNYKAGIKVSDEASPAGLGFSYGAGSIYRKVVFVPDDCKGGLKEDNKTPRYYSTPKPDPSDICKTRWWVYFLGGLFLVIGIALMFIPSGQGPGGAILATVLPLVSYGLTVLQTVLFTPNQYIGGGTHVPGYATTLNPGEQNYGKGYWYDGADDLPDVYFVNCPYLSGQLAILKDSQGGKYFSLRQSSGTSVNGKTPVKIYYDNTRESFSIVLQDGTRLLFEQGVYSKNYNATFWQFHPGIGTACSSVHEEIMNDSLPDQWLLTKVLFPDFSDGLNGDNDPRTQPEMNKGSWIVYKYDVKKYNGVSQLPFSSQGAPYTSTVSHGNGFLMDVYLDSIITPNQYAKFFYSGTRSDALWFNISDFTDWPKPGSNSLGDVNYWDNYRNREPVATYLKAKSGSNIKPVIRNVLDSILFYSFEKVKIHKVAFKMDYSLRPKSFTSFSKDINGNFISIDDNNNSNSASLTLKSLVISGADSRKNSQINFSYTSSNPEATSFVYNMPEGCADDDGDDGYEKCNEKRMAYYIEQRDLYGYYSQNLTSLNDFNERGTVSKSKMVDAWSLQKITFPTGSSIAWEYEPQRYDRANNVSVRGEHIQTNGSDTYFPLFYGGGIRVRKVVLNDEITNKNTWNYFYTDEGYYDFVKIDGKYNEIASASTGHATVEPFPYRLVEGDDLREKVARGGIYTPCQVFYERVQVAKNFDEQNWAAPYGYVFNEIYTSKEQPNLGTYGETDYSWRRGFPYITTVYNANGSIISQNANYYSFLSQNSLTVSNTENIFDTLNLMQKQNTYGWIRLDSTVSKINGVSNTREFKYDAGSTFFRPVETTVFDAGKGIAHPAFLGAIESSISYCTMKQSDLKLDAIIINSGSTQNYVTIGANIFPDENSENFLNKWTAFSDPFHGGGLPNTNSHVIGSEFRTINSNTEPDLVFVVTDHAGGIYLCVIYDIGVDFVTKKMTYKGYSETVIDYIQAGAPGWPALYFTSCLISDIDNNGTLDLLLLAGGDGDRYSSAVDGSPIVRKFYCITDLVFTNGNYTPTANQFFTPEKDYTLKGLKINKIDCEKDGLLDDILITGPVPSLGSSNNRPFASTCMKSISLDYNTHKVKFSNDSPVHTNNLFNLDDRVQAHLSLFFYTGATYDVVSKKLTSVFYDGGSGTNSEPPNLFVVDYGKNVYYGDRDGQPNQITEKISNTEKRIIKTIPASTIYQDMNTLNILSPVCQTTVYKGPETTGSVLHECWFNIPGSSIEAIKEKLNSKPDGVRELSKFECPLNLANEYGVRVSGYVVSPITGYYTFWISSGGCSELWLSKDENSANASLIATVDEYTGYREWEKRVATQKSVQQYLLSGKKYYIEAIYKQDKRNDHMSVGWQLPNGTSEMPILGSNLIPMSTPKHVVSAQVTTWSPYRGSNTWIPDYMFTWNNSKGDYTGFSFPDKEDPPVDPSTLNTQWQCTGIMQRCNKFGQQLETKNAKLISNSTIYRNDNHLPIASIANSRYEDCAVFTGDYDLNENGYFDKENGWEKGGALFAEDFDPRIFGAAVLVEGTFGPTRNMYSVDPNKDYIFSAYVFPTTTVPMRFTVEPHKDNSITPTSQNSDGLLNGLSINKWQLVTKKITGKMLKDWGFDGTNDYLRVWIGNYPADTKSRFYLNDIRFYPANAHVTTTYYHPIHNQVVGSIDENNKPGLRIGYDSFGRPEIWEKLDLTKSPYVPNYATAVKSMQYHMHSELLAGEDIQILYPNVLESFRRNEQIQISWVQKDRAVIDISFKKEGSSSSESIIQKEFPSGQNEWQWEIPSTAAGYYRIIATSPTQTDKSDYTFKVETNPIPPEWSMSGGTIELNNAVLKWHCLDEDGDVLTYKIVIEGGNDPEHEYTTNSLQYTILPQDLVAGEQYLCRIYAIDPAGNIAPGQRRVFIVEQ